MKRLKLILSSVAIIIAATAAFALREQYPLCTSLPQYYFDGSRYQPAGRLGVDYLCQASPSDTCTYIFQNNTYTPCRMGTRVTVNQ